MFALSYSRMHVCRYRRIRGDGNCYYRAVVFGLIEQIILERDMDSLEATWTDVDDDNEEGGCLVRPPACQSPASHTIAQIVLVFFPPITSLVIAREPFAFLFMLLCNALLLFLSGKGF